MSKPVIILIGHKMRVGKDTFAQYLSNYLDGSRKVQVLSFASNIKEIITEVFDIDRQTLEYFKNMELSYGYEDEDGSTRWVDSFRGLLQKFGNGKMKNIFGEHVWAKALTNNIDPQTDIVIIPDFRFPIEYSYLSNKFPVYTVKVERPNTELSSNTSETALDHFNFDYHFLNDKGKEHLKALAYAFGALVELSGLEHYDEKI